MNSFSFVFKTEKRAIMGIDYDNCAICGDIYPDCDDYGHCESCGSSWCSSCNESHSSFMFDGRERCTLCFKTQPDEVKPRDLLALALKKLGCSESDLAHELRRDGPERFRVPRDSYFCMTRHEEDFYETAFSVCGNAECDVIGDDWNLDDEDDSQEKPRRGICCIARGRRGDDLCTFCAQAQSNYACKMACLQVMKSHAEHDGAFCVLSRDVLLGALIKPLIWATKNDEEWLKAADQLPAAKRRKESEEEDGDESCSE
jgi:hypothetical protein